MHNSHRCYFSDLYGPKQLPSKATELALTQFTQYCHVITSMKLQANLWSIIGHYIQPILYRLLDIQ